TVSHTFATAGSYTVQVIATDSYGNASQAATAATAVSNPPAPIDPTPPVSSTPAPVQTPTPAPVATHSGIFVTGADAGGGPDGKADIICGAGVGGGPNVTVFNGSGSRLGSFFAFDQARAGGLFVGSGDMNGDGKADIVVGSDHGAEVAVFDGAGDARLADYFA